MQDNYVWGLGALTVLSLIVWYLAIFGRVDKSDENKSVSHRISKKR